MTGKARGPLDARVTAVLVAYNRRELLRESLEALAAQSRPVDRLVVVDNASTDDSAEVAASLLENWGPRARFIRLDRNTGGAGGFAVGIAAAVADPDTDWVWVMDDDTIPGPDALAGALETHARYLEGGADNLAVMGSRVVWTDGEDHPMNTPKAKILMMSTEEWIAQNFYLYFGLPWTDLQASQYLGGGVAWAGGELPLLLVIIVLGIQWSRQDAKEARRKDRHMDSGRDEEFDDYNKMLETLAKRRQAAGPGRSTSRSDEEPQP